MGRTAQDVLKVAEIEPVGGGFQGQLDGPPGGGTIFKLGPEGVKVIAATLRTKG